MWSVLIGNAADGTTPTTILEFDFVWSDEDGPRVRACGCTAASRVLRPAEGKRMHTMHHACGDAAPHRCFADARARVLPGTAGTAHYGHTQALCAAAL